MRRTYFRTAVLLFIESLALTSASCGEEIKPSYLSAELAASRPSAAAPVRLPPIEVLMFESAAASTPFLFTPIASLNLDEFQTAPAVKLGVGQPIGEKPSIGGWISFGAGGYVGP